MIVNDEFEHMSMAGEGTIPAFTWRNYGKLCETSVRKVGL